ncbi:Uncharacterized WD repeat-containing protein C9G1.05 [Taphrina deformans PYCC 5710]|uniref:Uncharacterized WD repeat-containing protein C9G1.05 n=1 Tax=Taphrina deformans (strain PYCC 5710 / ATCC 11124 / CBS 356.35 / IMI 108563 / JCM 9778 / NBRC 8474) TaxID=1097556 RepID=R4X7N7_TAPDE|nr:Uncharacterized WD repeat-containing protein C9G1.05 [Taphrina deformans PYCC 5710]|eukprot:CCG81173.1 Uncharacterized WD repeat-containing protein C9G1.05 [Taphrina deformans PYCC 5710]
MTDPRIPGQIIAPQPATTRAAPVHLSVDAKGTKVAYTSNKAVYLRSLEDPSQCIQYTGHKHPTTVAKFSPSGFYVASGDTSGSVRIWGCDTADQILKQEVKVINGRITDLAWDGESQRIIAVGEGKEKWGHAFTYDAGNAVGEIAGHSSVPNAVAIKSSRPFRAATAGDDGLVVFYHGAPYKYNKSIRRHTTFVYDVKFSPDGTHLVSVGADARIFVYDAKTGDDVKELIDEKNCHKGSIFAVSWDPTSKFILTSSADQSVKVWNVETSKVVMTWDLPEDIPVNGQQVGNLWTEKWIVTLSFSGTLTYLSRDSSSPSQVIRGHQKSLTALTASRDGHQLYSGSYDTTVYHWLLDGRKVTGTRLNGNVHSNSILQIVQSDMGAMSIGMDDTLRTIVGSSYQESQSLPAQPKGLGSLANGRYVLATSSNVIVYKGTEKLNQITVSFAISAATARGNIVALGTEDSSVHVLNGALEETCVLKSNRAVVTALAISHDGTKIAVGDASGKIILYSASTGEAITTRWAFHVGRISSLEFNATDTKVISASLDTHVYVWSTESPSKKIAIKNAHQGGVSGAVWISESRAVSSGSDGALKIWEDLSF